jgi:hypothetical protein
MVTEAFVFLGGAAVGFIVMVIVSIVIGEMRDE